MRLYKAFSDIPSALHCYAEWHANALQIQLLLVSCAALPPSPTCTCIILPLGIATVSYLALCSHHTAAHSLPGKAASTARHIPQQQNIPLTHYCLQPFGLSASH